MSSTIFHKPPVDKQKHECKDRKFVITGTKIIFELNSVDSDTSEKKNILNDARKYIKKYNSLRYTYDQNTFSIFKSKEKCSSFIVKDTLKSKHPRRAAACLLLMLEMNKSVLKATNLISNYIKEDQKTYNWLKVTKHNSKITTLINTLFDKEDTQKVSESKNIIPNKLSESDIKAKHIENLKELGCFINILLNISSSTYCNSKNDKTNNIYDSFIKDIIKDNNTDIKVNIKKFIDSLLYSYGDEELYTNYIAFKNINNENILSENLKSAINKLGNCVKPT